MKCFDVRRKGEGYLAWQAPQVLPMRLRSKDGNIPFGSGASDYAAIADLCAQLDRTLQSPDFVPTVGAVAAHEPTDNPPDFVPTVIISEQLAGETMAVHHSRELLGQNRRLEEFVSKSMKPDFKRLLVRFAAWWQRR